MPRDPELFKKIISHAREYGFVFPSSEIYEGLSAVYDYGQNGVELKNNIRDCWWKAMVQMNSNIVGIDAAILMHPKTWHASGHVDAFNDPMIDNRDSKKRYRADTLIEEHLEKVSAKIDKEIEKAKKRYGDEFNPVHFVSTNKKVMDYRNTLNDIGNRLKEALNSNNLKELNQIIADLNIADPESGSKNWTEVRQFNLMFETSAGSANGEVQKIYLRPETAQGIFVNFLNVLKTARMKIPFGIAQAGKAFRNEIVARQFIFRMKEFEQMEMQFFVKPGEEMKWYEYWKKQRMKWFLELGFPPEKIKFHEHEKLAHYANAAVDIEFEFPIGFRELEGIHSRTDFDLGAHEKFSGKKLKYFDPDTKESYTPYVVETSLGLDRTFMAVLSLAYTEEQLPDGSSRVALKIPPRLAPVKAAIFPLLKRDGLPEVAERIFNEIRHEFFCQYEEKDTIGKRYRRQDAIGTPFCITVDHQTLNDETVTLRYRDTMEQERISIRFIKKALNEKMNIQA